MTCYGQEKNSATPLELKVGIFVDGYQFYAEYMSDDLCSRDIDFKKEQLHRIVVEVLLACRALALQNYQLKPIFVPIPNEVRGMYMLEQGLLDTLSGSLWRSYIGSSPVWISQQVIRKGEFEKGLYVSIDNKTLLTTPVDEIDIESLLGIAIPRWHLDLQVMKSLTPNITQTDYVPSLIRSVSTGRADFVLMEFSSAFTLKFCGKDACLLPIPGVKVVIRDSRHIVASLQTQQGKLYAEQLSKGLTKMRQRGEIRQLYVASGLINESVKDWKVLN